MEKFKYHQKLAIEQKAKKDADRAKNEEIKVVIKFSSLKII